MPDEQSRNRRLFWLIAVLVLVVIAAFTFMLQRHLSGRQRSSEIRVTDLSSRQLCGPYSLHTAASMLGTQIDLPVIVAACNPSPEGVSMATLKKVAGKFGFDAKGYRLTWEKLLELQSPAILYVKPTHFVTVNPSKYPANVSAVSFRVFDSDKAPQTWSRERLEKSWSGETLVISKVLRHKSPKGPRIDFDCLVYDLGDVRVPLNKKLNVPLIFANVGNKELKINRVKTSCGCAKTAVSGEVIQSGQKGKIDIAVDLDKERGSFDYFVLVETNDPVIPMAKTRITGRTFNTQLTMRKELLLTAIPRAGRTSKSFVLRDPGDGSLKRSDSAVELYISPATLAGENGKISIKAACGPFDENKHHRMKATENDLIVDIVAEASESAPIGEFHGTLEVKTEIPNNRHIRIPVRGRVISSIAAKPAALFFSNAKGESTSKVVTLENRNGQTVNLKTISLSESLPLKVEKHSDSIKTSQLIVTYSPTSETGSAVTGDIICNFTDETLVIPVIIH